MRPHYIQTIPETLLNNPSGPPILLYGKNNGSPEVITREELLTHGALLARHFQTLGLEPRERE